MDPVVVIPVKSFDSGFARLATQFDGDTRRELAQAFATHVAETTEASGLAPMFVTGDPAVASWATALGFPSIPEAGTGLNEAAQTGVDWALRSGSPWLIVHSDLPLLTVGEIRRLVEVVSESHDVIAPSADGGTSAIGSSRPVDFAFGRGSFAKHLPRLNDPVVVASLGLLHDVDTPGDVRSVARHARGDWLSTYIG